MNPGITSKPPASAIRQAAWQFATLLLGALLFSGPSQADWVSSGRYGMPVDAIVGGTDAGGQLLYLCSAYEDDGYHSGKSRADWNACDVGCGGGENYEFQKLALVPDWAPATGGNFSY